MDARSGRYFVDTGPFVLDLAFPADPRAALNRRFLQRLVRTGGGWTGVVNLLEVAGAISFHSSADRVRRLVETFSRLYAVRIWPAGATRLDEAIEVVLARLTRRMTLGDALVLCAAEECRPRPRALVTWNPRHFEGRTDLLVRTPQQILRGT
jgi:predicted nucleic acid-binding protein